MTAVEDQLQLSQKLESVKQPPIGGDLVKEEEVELTEEYETGKAQEKKLEAAAGAAVTVSQNQVNPSQEREKEITASPLKSPRAKVHPSTDTDRKLMATAERTADADKDPATAKAAGKDEKGEPELTEEQKAAKKAKFEKANAKAKEMIKGLFQTYKCQIIVGLLGNIFGMTAELVSPLYVGFIIDAIVEKKMEEIDRLVIIWMSITVASSILNGLQTFLLNDLTQKIGFIVLKN